MSSPASDISCDVSASCRRAWRCLWIGTMVGLMGVSGLLLVLVRHGDTLAVTIQQSCAEQAYQLAETARAQHDLTEAVQQYRIALNGRFRDENLRLQCLFALGDVLAQQGAFQDAVVVYRQLPPQAFTQPGLLTGYVTALFKAAHYDEALSRGKEWAMLADTQHDVTQQVWAYTTLGHIQTALHQVDDAAESYRKAVALEPGCHAALYLAELRITQQRMQDAAAILQTFLEHATDETLRTAAQQLLATVQPPHQ